MLTWRPGPKRKGCVYHQQGLDRHQDSNLVVDIFVMPAIVRRRPVAITIGLYRDYKPMAKLQWCVRRPGEIDSTGAILDALFEKLGIPGPVASAHAQAVRKFVRGATKEIEAALVAASKGAA